MRHIMVMNAKGGCGKSTLATNLASYFANEGLKTALADYDPQRTSLDWLGVRPAERPAITGVAAFDEGLRAVPRDTQILIIDAPARTHGTEMNELVRRAETILVPVLPSPIDIKAAGRFLEELLELGKLQREQARLAVIANRVRENTLIFHTLEQYLGSLKVPYLAALRQSSNYLRAFDRGLGVFELPEYLASVDWEQWAPLTKWLGSKRSQPG
jgi:chromosome partitioning protein